MDEPSDRANLEPGQAPAAQIIPPLADRLPKLLPAETTFVDRIAAGLSATDAYAKAYPSRVRGKSRRSVTEMACRLKLSPRIQHWISAISEAGMLRAVASREDHSAQLVRIRERAIVTNQLSAAVTAEIHVGKVAGLYLPDSRARELEGLGDTGFAARIAIEMPELAAGLARLLPAPRTERPVPPGEKPGDDR